MKHPQKLFNLLIISCAFITFTGYAQSNEKNDLSICNKTSTKVLIVTYSYSDNTRAVAIEIAKHFNADTIFIKAKKYKGFTGVMKANYDAWKEVIITDIEPETIDMSQYDLIFLGSPIWWYRPAVPLWTFVEKNDFQGKAVVLFNTFNSKFKEKYIEKFKKIVENKGGRFLNHLYIRRGRWYNQLSREELLKKFNKLLDTKEEKFQ
jgi:flavodoxin